MINEDLTADRSGVAKYNNMNSTSECAYHLGNQAVCMSKSTLDKLATKLKINDDVKSEKELLEKVKKALGVDKEIDVIKRAGKQNIISEKEVTNELYKRYKPIGTWAQVPLSNSEVDHVLDLFELKFDDFINLHFNMIDFEDYGGPLCKADFEAMYFGKSTKFEMPLDYAYKTTPNKKFRTFTSVVNSDNSDGPGKHWTCVFIDLKNAKWSIEFYNSSGNPTYPEILKWQIELKDKLEDMAESHKLRVDSVDIVEVTNIRHQFSATECGVFCIYYIYQRLCGVPYSNFKHNPIIDDDVFKFRETIFAV